MATATPVTQASGLRGVRDKYLALLLSDVQAQAASAVPAVGLNTAASVGAGVLGMNATTTPSAWTPGGKFPFTPFNPNSASAQQPPLQQPLWTSPITPSPHPHHSVSHVLPTATDADVRLAELTAGLVAANDNENRQAEAIRRLSGQLERTERQLRLYQRTRVPPRPSSFPAAGVHGHDNSKRASHHNVNLPPQPIPIDNDDEHDNVFEDNDHLSDYDRHHHRRSHPHHQSDHNYDPNSPPKPSRPPPSSGRRRRRTEMHATDGVEPVPLDRSQGVRRQSTRPDGRGRGRADSPQRDAIRPNSRGNQDGVRLSFEDTSRAAPERGLERDRQARHDENEYKRIHAQQKDDHVKELQRKVEQYEKEIGLFSKVFSDVKKGQQRLLDERAAHLNLIMRQRELLASLERRMGRSDSGKDSDDLHFRKREDLNAASYSPRRRSSSPVSDQQSRRGSSDERDGSRLGSNRSRQQSSAPISAHSAESSDRKRSTTAEKHDRDRVQRNVPKGDNVNKPDHELIRDDETVTSSTGERNFDPNETFPTPREAALAEELRIVLNENAVLYGKVPQLEAQCQQLKRQLFQVENDSTNKEESGGLRDSKADLDRDARSRSNETRANSGKDRLSKYDPDEISRLVEEVDVLEGVADAIRFGVGVATGMTTGTNLGETTVDGTTMASLGERQAGEARSRGPVDDADVVAAVTERVAKIRSSLSVKYGQWLEAVGHQTVTATHSQDLSKSSRGSKDKSKDSKRSKDTQKSRSSRHSTSSKSASSTTSTKRPPRDDALLQETAASDEPMNTEIIEQLVNS